MFIVIIIIFISIIVYSITHFCCFVDMLVIFFFTLIWQLLLIFQFDVESLLLYYTCSSQCFAVVFLLIWERSISPMKRELGGLICQRKWNTFFFLVVGGGGGGVRRFLLSLPKSNWIIKRQLKICVICQRSLCKIVSIGRKLWEFVQGSDFSRMWRHISLFLL